jgi:hypothetical protein
MNLLKETAIESIKRLPEGCTVEDIMYRIDLVARFKERQQATPSMSFPQ